jgi:hypothetical protein
MAALVAREAAPRATPGPHRGLPGCFRTPQGPLPLLGHNTHGAPQGPPDTEGPLPLIGHTHTGPHRGHRFPSGPRRPSGALET